MTNVGSRPPIRRSIRLQGYDYAQAGIYFVTICTHRKKCLLGSVANDRVALSALGEIVRECWMRIPEHFPRVKLDAFVVMPNHLHGVLVLHRTTASHRAQHAAPLQPTRNTDLQSEPNVKSGTLSAVIRSFKSAVSKRAHREWPGTPSSTWQRNYYEHIIRNGGDLDQIRRYIRNNPQRWAFDKENPSCR